MSDTYIRRQTWKSYLTNTDEIDRMEKLAQQSETLFPRRDDDAGTFTIEHEDLGCIYTALQIGPDLEPAECCWLVRASCTRYDITQTTEEAPEGIEDHATDNHQ